MEKPQKRRRMKVNNKIKLTNSVRVSLILLAVVILAIGSGNLIKSLTNTTEVVKESKEIYNYKNQFSENATINLKDNQFVKKDEILEGQTYLSDLISSIDMDMKYQYTGSQQIPVNYNYKIEAVVKSVYSSSKGNYDVLNKVEVLKASDNKTSNSKDILINEKVNIDYAKYHQMIKNFKQEMGINTDSYLYIKLTVDTETNINSQKIENQYVSDYSITLGDKVALIEEKAIEPEVKVIKGESSINTEANVDINGAMFYAFIAIMGLVFLRVILTKTEKLNAIKNEYKLELNRIMKFYADKIVEVKDLDKNELSSATKVKDMVQLIKLAEEALVPIYAYIKDDPEDEAYFIVRKYDKSYAYVLK